MSSGVVADASAKRALRLCIDINVWVAFLISMQHGRAETAAQTIVAIARDMTMADRPVQLITSVEMADTLERVLTRVGFSASSAHHFANATIDLMKAGPEQLDPYLLLSSRDQLAMHDREDAGVLATAIAAKADLLVTDNLKAFQTNDSETIKTRTVLAQGAERQLFGIIHERQDDTALVIAHPIDVVAWLRESREITPAMVRTLYGT